MSNTIKIKRGTNLSNAGTPAAGELIYKTDTNALYVGDGSTAATGLTAIGGSATINNSNWSGTDLAVANGGTGASSFTSNAILTGNGTSAIQSESNLTFDGSTLALTGNINYTGNLQKNGLTLMSIDGSYTTILKPAGGVGIYLGQSDASHYYDNTRHRFRPSGGGSNYYANLGATGLSLSRLADAEAKLHIGEGSNSNNAMGTNTLGTTSGNSIDNIKISTDSTNHNQLIFSSERVANGSDWTTTRERIRRKIDGSDMGYIQFGSAFGSNEMVGIGRAGVGTALSVDGNLRVGVRTLSPDTLLHIVNSGSGSTSTLKLEDNAREMYLGRDAIKVTTLDGSTAAQLYINSNTTFSGSIVTGANIDVGGLLSVTSSITTNYGVAFTNGNTNFLMYNNTGDNLIYLRDTTNSAMLQTWTPSATTIHKNLTLSSGFLILSGSGSNEGGEIQFSPGTSGSYTTTFHLDSFQNKLRVHSGGAERFYISTDGTIGLNGTVAGSAVLDEDDMASDNPSKLASQQSIKAYVDANAGSNTASDGSASAPAFNFSSDTNTGMFRIGSDTLGFSAGGSTKLQIKSDGRVNYNGWTGVDHITVRSQGHTNSGSSSTFYIKFCTVVVDNSPANYNGLTLTGKLYRGDNGHGNWIDWSVWFNAALDNAQIAHGGFMRSNGAHWISNIFVQRTAGDGEIDNGSCTYELYYDLNENWANNFYNVATEIHYPSEGKFNVTWNHDQSEVTSLPGTEVVNMQSNYYDDGNQTLVQTGVASAPSYSFLAQRNTGMYGFTDNTIGFSNNGTRMLSIKADGSLELRSDGSSQGASIQRVGQIQFTWDRDSYGTSNNHAIVCDSDNLIINSFDDVTINLDSNNNDSSETFDVRKHSTSLTGGTLLFQVDGAGLCSSYGGYGTINGSAGSPSFRFNSDSNTGMYRTAEDCIGFSVGGNIGMQLTSAHALRIYQSDDTTDYMEFYANDTHAFYHHSHGTMHRFITDSGYIELGPANSGWGHIQTDRDKFYFNKKIVVDEGIVAAYDEDLSLRRSYANTDDEIVIEASEIKFRTDAVERLKMGSAGITINRNANPNADTNMAINLSGSYGGGIHFTDTKHSGIWCLGSGTEMHFGVGGTTYAGLSGDQGLFMMHDNGDFNADADVIAFSSSVGSDRKLKENIQDTPYGLSDVMKMRAVEFDWKEKRQGVHDIGVIAQEIEEIIPEVVRDVKSIGGSEGTHKVVDYGKLASVLIKAIQEQQQQINKLEEKLNG